MPKTKTKCQPHCRRLIWLDKIQDHLLHGTYILCGSLIIYSLLMFNILAAGDPQVPGNNFLLISVKNVSSVVQVIWFDTVLFMDKLGSQMGEPLKDTIALYQRGLAKVFVVTGEILAKVPKILTAPPLQAQAMR